MGGIRFILLCQHPTITPAILETPRTWGYGTHARQSKPVRTLPWPLAIRSNTSHAFDGILLLIKHSACMQRVNTQMEAKPSGSVHELPIGSI